MGKLLLPDCGKNSTSLEKIKYKLLHYFLSSYPIV